MARRSGFDARFPARDPAVARALDRNVPRLRKARNLSQDDLAAEVGIQTAAVSHLENRRGNPTLANLVRRAEALGVRFIDLFRSRE